MSLSLDLMSFTTRSPMRTMPLVISSRPATIRSSVVLPQPDAPTSTMNLPSGMSRFTSVTACVPSSYTLVTSCSEISDITATSLSRRLPDHDPALQHHHPPHPLLPP